MEIKPIVTSNFVVLNEDVTITEALSQFRAGEDKAGLVYRKDKYLGMVNLRETIKSRLDVSTVKIKNFVSKTPFLNENTDVLEAARMFYQTGLDFLPIEKDKKIIGVINALELAKYSMALPEVKSMRVSDIKFTKSSKVAAKDKLSKALTIMHDQSVDHVPVFEEDKISGVLSFRDVLNKYHIWTPQSDFMAKPNVMMKTKRAQVEPTPIVSLPVSSFSSTGELRKINSMDALSVAVTIMYNNKIHDLLAIDNEEYKGMLTVRNIFNKLSAFNAPKEYSVQFIGLKDSKLSSADQFSLQKLAENEAMKLQRKIKQRVDISLHLKEHGKKDKGREKFSVTLRMNLPGKTIVSEYDDWDPFGVMKSSFDHAQQEAMKVIGKQLAKDKNVY